MLHGRLRLDTRTSSTRSSERPLLFDNVELERLAMVEFSVLIVEMDSSSRTTVLALHNALGTSDSESVP
jgi:hypothetical protein